jgi:hypothetical protein
VITVQVDECPVSSWVFVQVDGIPAGVAYPYNTIPPAFEIPTHEFSNGNHTLSLGGYTYEGGCWMREIPVQFKNSLYLASIPERYEPNEVYEIWGYFNSGTMQISTDPNSITVSDSGYICHSTMINSGTAEASLYYESGEFSESQYIVLAKAVDMSKIDPNSFRALIIAPDIKANKDFKISLEAIRNALLAKNISCQELLHKDATWENISVALQGGNLNYVYWIGHSDSQIGETRDPITLKIIKEGVHRTNFKCWKKGVLSDSLEDRIFSCMASDKITIPAVPEILPDNWEKKGHSMWSLKLWQTMRIKEFWVIGCESGLEWENAGVKYNHFNDMACAVGAYYQDNQGNYVHVYIGTRKPVLTVPLSLGHFER